MQKANTTASLLACLFASTSAALGQTPFPLTSTGQDACYDVSSEIACPAEGQAYFGQDAQFAGTPQSFTENGDGTVLDNVTGLLWERTPSDERMFWSDAQDYCAVLELAGRDDWRTPNLYELFGISNFSEGWPYLDNAVFDLSGAEKDQQFWSSNFYKVGTTHGGAPSAFGVNHITGHIKAYPAGAPADMPADNMPPPPPQDGAAGAPPAAQPESLQPEFGKLVRCVAGEEIGENLFENNGDGSVTDMATGLMWSQTDAGRDMDWEAALAYAEEMNARNYLGHSDWRLPNVRELQSIVDYSGVFPAIDAEFFEWTEADRYYWTSTSAYFNTDEPERHYAWYVAFGYAPGPDGEDIHGAGAVRFIGKAEESPYAEGDYRPLNAVRLVRDAS